MKSGWRWTTSRRRWSPVIVSAPMNRRWPKIPDFQSIADDPEFQRLAELTKPISQRNVYRQLDFILGKWILTSADGRRIGSAEFTAGGGGYAIVGRMRGQHARHEVYHPRVLRSGHRPVEASVAGRSGQRDPTGQPDDEFGESFVLDGETTTADGRNLLTRAEFDEAGGRHASTCRS